MEKTGCKIICGAPTTLAVKGFMMIDDEDDVCKWCIEFDFYVHNFHLLRHHDAQLYLKLLDRKLRFSEAGSSWASRWESVSWQEYFPLPENKSVYARLASAARFQMSLLCWLNKRKKRSSESMASSKEVVETPQCKLCYQRRLLLGLWLWQLHTPLRPVYWIS